MDRGTENTDSSEKTEVNHHSSYSLAESSPKRKGYLSWEEYFMALAFLSAQRSKDPVTQVGACIIDSEKRIVGVGYNGFPKGCCDDEFPWGKEDKDPINTKYFYVIHAELNAILNKNCSDLKGCTLYVTLAPCAECAKIIIQSGISRVIYADDKHHNETSYVAARRMMDSAGTKYMKYKPTCKKVSIVMTV